MVDLVTKEVSTILKPRPLKCSKLIVNKKNDDLWIAGTINSGIYKVVNGNLIQFHSGSPLCAIFDTFSECLITWTANMMIQRFHINQQSHLETLYNSTGSWQPPKSFLFDEDRRTIYYLIPPRLFAFDLKSNKMYQITESEQMEKMYCPIMVVDMEGYLYFRNWYSGLSMMIMPMPWKLARILWIARYKNVPEQCPFASLPRELIKEILVLTRAL